MSELAGNIAADIEAWDAIDDHRTGTAGDRQTSDWLAGRVKSAGSEPRRDDFALSRWVLKRCALDVDGTVVEGVPLFDGGTTGPEGVVGGLGLLGESRGAAGIGVGAFGNAAGATGALAAFRRTNDYRAIVAVSKMDERVTGLALQNADRFSEPFGPPVLQVATEHEKWLHEASSAGAVGRLTAHVSLESATGSNVYCRVRGRDPALAPLTVVTPKSAWWVCTAERGGGIAVWLALLRHFAANRPARDVVFIATTGHELGHLGLDHFLATKDTPPSHGWIHLGANFAAVDSRIRLQASDAELMDMAQRTLSTHGVTVSSTTPLGSRPGGEARNIHDLGERYVSLLGSNRWFHHPDDRWPTTIDLHNTGRVARAVLAIATRLV
ncbi:MAG: M28 family peptidase [Gammaproteobacteria bacterium]|nr:M28 family peptidase [Gammaproteobacteria bacterium]